MTVLRQAARADIPGMQRVRQAVLENTIPPGRITDEAVRAAIEDTGRGWVVELDGDVVAFAIGNGITGNIWALFVDPAHEGRGYGRRLHDEMLGWLWSRGLQRLWLSTDPGTRAEHFYKAAGWQCLGILSRGEVHFERYPP